MALGTLHTFAMHRGDSRRITFTVVDEADVAVDVTGAAMTWVLARSDDDEPSSTPAPRGAALVTKAIGTGITLTNAVAGEGEVVVDEVDTTGLKAPDDYYHELQVELGGETTTVLFGLIQLKRDIIAPGP